MRRNCVVVLLAFVVAPLLVYAGEPPVSMMDYLKKAGLADLLEQQREAEAKAAEAQLSGMIAQMTEPFDGLPEAYLAEIEAMSQRIVDATLTAYTTQELLEVYAAPFDKNYSVDELQEMIAELSTPEGMKLIKTVNEASNAMYAFRAVRQEAAVQAATQQFVDRFREITEEMRDGE